MAISYKFTWISHTDNISSFRKLTPISGSRSTDSALTCDFEKVLIIVIFANSWHRNPASYCCFLKRYSTLKQKPHPPFSKPKYLLTFIIKILNTVSRCFSLYLESIRNVTVAIFINFFSWKVTEILNNDFLWEEFLFYIF